jgi:catechol 2,3-dioxygenase-like lactoylglutathione lyase family enzyme
MARLAHLAIRCRDMERSRAFNEELIGWRFVGYRPSRQGLDLTDGLKNITLLQQPLPCERPTLEEGNEYLHFGVVVDDLLACWQRLRDAGATFVRDDIKARNAIAVDQVPQRSFKVLDSEGNIVDVTADRQEFRRVSW